MIENIFANLPQLFKPETIQSSVTYYFSLGKTKKTVKLSSTEINVEDGKTIDKADCVCKTSEEFFLKIWEENYRPGLKDFMSGVIKSNNPDKLKTFLTAFGKAS